MATIHIMTGNVKMRKQFAHAGVRQYDFFSYNLDKTPKDIAFRKAPIPYSDEIRAKLAKLSMQEDMTSAYRDTGVDPRGPGVVSSASIQRINAAREDKSTTFSNAKRDVPRDTIDLVQVPAVIDVPVDTIQKKTKGKKRVRKHIPRTPEQQAVDTIKTRERRAKKKAQKAQRGTQRENKSSSDYLDYI